MKYKIVKLTKFSGNEATIYSIYIFDKKKTLFELFLEENKILYKSELISIFNRLKVIGHETGARENFFKIHEGELGDGLSALFDRPDKKLRLYCIRYGSLILIAGGGGPKKSQTFQEDEKLKQENFFLRKVVKDIKNKMEFGDIEISKDGTEFLGNLEFTDDEKN